MTTSWATVKPKSGEAWFPEYVSVKELCLGYQCTKQEWNPLSETAIIFYRNYQQKCAIFPIFTLKTLIFTRNRKLTTLTWFSVIKGGGQTVPLSAINKEMIWEKAQGSIFRLTSVCAELFPLERVEWSSFFAKLGHFLKRCSAHPFNSD